MSALKSVAISAGAVHLGWASFQVMTLSGSMTVTFLIFFRRIEVNSRVRSRSSEEYSPIELEAT